MSVLTWWTNDISFFIFSGQHHLFVQAKTCFLTGKYAIVIPSNGYFKLHWGNSGIIEKLLACLWERGSAILACSEIQWVICNRKLKWPTELMNWFCCHREEFTFLKGKMSVPFFYKNLKNLSFLAQQTFSCLCKSHYRFDYSWRVFVVLLSCQILPGLVLTPDCSSHAALGVIAHSCRVYFYWYSCIPSTGYRHYFFFLHVYSYRLKKKPTDI